MKTIIKKITFLSFAFLSVIASAQEDTTQENNESRGIFCNSKFKTGFSTLKFNENEAIEGSAFQFDLAFSNRLSKMFLLEYGTRISTFRANYFEANANRNIEYQTVGIPVNLVFFKDINSTVSFSYGLGFYGNYLYKVKMGSIIDEENVGFNFGVGLQGGVILKVTQSAGFGIMFDLQRDLSKIEKDDLEFRQINTSLVSLSFCYKL